MAPDGTITTIAGGGTTSLSPSGEHYAPDGTLATDLTLAGPSGLAIDGKGNLYVSDGLNHAVFRFGAAGRMTLVIADQKGAQTAGLPASQTRATNVGPLAVDAHGNLLYVESSVLRSIAGAGS